MKRFLAGLLMFILAFGALWAQDAGSWFVGKPIVGFQFQGLKQVNEGELLTLLSPYRNQVFSYDIYWEMQNKLYALEYFESVAADAIPGDTDKKTVIISFQMKERPLVSKIIFSGNNNMTEKELRDAILIKERAVWSEAKVRLDLDAIKGIYRNKGFLDIDVAYAFKTNEIDGMVDVTFTVKEGAKTTVKKILFSGNQFASEGTIKGLLQTKEPGLFVNSDFQENKLKEDTDAIENYYSEHGYYFAKVEKVDRQLELNEAEQRKYIILTFYIKEGTQYTYGAATFQGNNIFPTEKLSPLFHQKTGDILSKKKFKEDFMLLVNLYYDNGYVSTQITPREKVDEGKKIISFDIVIVEGDRSHIGRIIIQGNVKTKESVIRRELPFQEGDIFNRAKIQRGYINLMRTGFFTRNVNFEPSAGLQEGLIDILITVEETQTANLEVGGSIIPGDFPFTAYANLVEKNFLGLGLSAGTNLNLTTTEQSLSGSYENNWLFGERLLGGINFSVKHQIVQNVPEDSMLGNKLFNGNEPDAVPDPFNTLAEYYAALDSGLGINPLYTMAYHTIEFRLGLTGGYSFDTIIGLLGFRIEPSSTLSYVEYDPTVDRPFSNVLRDDLRKWLFINQLGLTFYITGTDIPQNPEQGYNFSQYVGFVGNFLFGSRSYIRTVTKAEFYLKFFEIPVTEDWKFKIVLALHSQLSFILPPLFGEQKSVDDDLFRVDGMFVGRGWNLRQRGEVLWDNKIELRMPIVQEALWWTIFFVDIVGLWQAPSDFFNFQNPNYDQNFFMTFGSGLRLTVPGLPMRLYLAKRFKIVNGNFQWQDGSIKFSDQFSLDLVFAIDITPF